MLFEVGPQTSNYVWIGGELLGVAVRKSPTTPRMRGSRFAASQEAHLGRS
jgi:hypothetical protein